MHHKLSVIPFVAVGLAFMIGSVPISVQAQNDIVKAKAIQKYLSDNFGVPGYKTTWYDSIKGITVQGNTVIVDTNLTAVNAKASGVCSGVSGYVFSNENRGLGLQNIEVRGPKSAVLIKRLGVRGKCS